MSSIRTAIQITDGMTSPLKHMSNALNIVTANFHSLQRTSGQAIDTASFTAARKEMAAANLGIQQMESELQRAATAQQNLNGKMREGNSAAGALVGKIRGIVAAYAGWQSVMGLVGATDAYNGISSRLDLINDGLQTTKELQDMIRDSANSTYSNYKDTADMVGKLGIQAGEAFSNNEDIVNFATQINKHLVIAGTNGAAAQGAMIQLTQAMSNGVLRGEELNSVMDGMPTVVKAIRKQFAEMGDTRGIKQIAEDGLITADIVKQALYNAADETNAQFAKLGVTFAGAWNLFKNSADKAMTPVYEKLKKVTSSADFQNFATAAGQAVATVAGVIVWALDLMASVGGFVTENWGLIEPIIWGVGAALIAYNAVLAANNIMTLLNTGYKAANAALTAILNARVMLMAGATLGATIAQYGLNAALLAFPGTWIVLAIIAIIGAFYFAVAAVNKFTGATWSATGLIAGFIAGLAATVINIFFGLINGIMQLLDSALNIIIGNVEWWLNVLGGGFDSFGDMCANLIGTVINWFLELGKVVTTIIDAIFGTDWTDGLNKLSKEVTSWGSKNKKITLERNVIANGLDAEGLKSRIERVGVGDWAKGAYDWGAEAADNLSLGNLLSIPQPEAVKPQKTAADMVANAGTIAQNTAQTAKNTSQASKSLQATEEELKYMRDAAEREAVNRFTTAEIKIDMKNNNTISNELDIDGFIGRLTGKLYDAMEVAAEGVHL